MNPWNFRQNNLEIRSCDKHLMGETPHTTAEIIRHIDNSVITIAFWVIEKESNNLMFVHDRPIDDEVDWDTFRFLISLGQKILDHIRCDDE